MEFPECPRRHLPVRFFSLLALIGSVSACPGQALSVTPRWQISLPVAASGQAFSSKAVPVSGGADLVAVVSSGTDASKPTLHMGTRELPADLIGYDLVSRLGFYRVGGAIAPKPMPWLERIGGADGVNLQALVADGVVKCKTNGWVKQVGGKILPLALLRVNFDKSPPPPGTPLVDESGRVAAILFQSSSGLNAAYAIPAEAVHRVQRDVYRGGKLVRGWLGLSLLAENQTPQIVRVLQGTPAAKAGVMPNDVLLSVGFRKISDYADAVNAFFYLIPGEPVKVQVMRGVETYEFDLTPTRPPAE